MKFIQWKLFEPLRVNSYGFLEPSVSGKRVNPDLIIVPLLAYDKFYNRLGYGKGYYDKFFTQYLKNRKNILTIGLAFSFQKYKKYQSQNLTVKLNYILTEKGIF
jgi:5-formyltetrahydrofolate cyclo-ligase